MAAAIALEESSEESGVSTLLDVVHQAGSSADGQLQEEESCLAADDMSSVEDPEPVGRVAPVTPVAPIAPVAPVAPVRSRSRTKRKERLVKRHRVTDFEGFERLRQAEEGRISFEQASGLRRESTLTVDSVLAELSRLLEFIEAEKKRQQTGEVHQNGDANGIICSTAEEEETILGLLRKNSARLGEAVVLLILQSSVAANYWGPIQVLVESKVVPGHACDELIQHLVEEGNAGVICSFVRNVVDLGPYCLSTTMQFVLGGSKDFFHQVLKDWTDAADAAIAAAAEKQNCLKLGTEVHSNGNKRPRFYRFGPRGAAIRSALAFAMAVDGFAAYELCLHDFVAAEHDAAVLGYVLRMLNSVEVLRVFRYLKKWVEKYSRRLAHDPFPKGTKRCRIPPFPKVLFWIGVIVDVQYARFIAGSDLLADLRTVQQSIRTMTQLSAKVSRIVGITEHMKPKGFPRAHNY